jgi:PAS domain S-box-containing protein
MSPIPGDGWPQLFATAFRQSRNAMLLTDDRRRILDANAASVALVGRPRTAIVGRPLWTLVADGPLLSQEEWRSALAAGRFDGVATLDCTDGRTAAVQWAASNERVSGGQRVLVVALSVSRWGARFRRDVSAEQLPSGLTRREQEIVRFVALGATGPEIADELRISHQTVRTHVRNAMEKLGARSRAHLVARALAEGHTIA